MLNRQEIAATRDELARNADLTGLTPAQIAADLGFTEKHLEQAMTLDRVSDPADVWQLRDYLEQAVRDGGGTPVHFTVLTEASRSPARNWFRLRPAPRHDFLRSEPGASAITR